MALHVCEGSGTPVGNVTPLKLSQHYTDTANGHTWMSFGLTDQDWVEVGSGTFAGSPATWEPHGEGIRPIDNKEISVGRPSLGAESVFGGGDSYNDDIYVISYDGTTYVDETSKILVSGDGNYLEFPSNNAGAIVYFGSNKDHDHTGNKISHCGFKSLITQAITLGSGSVVFEYYSASGWVEFTMMTTDANHPYQSYGQEIMLHTGTFQTRYNARVCSDWIETSVDGKTLLWTRARIVSDIGSSMKLDFLKLHTSRVEINATGFMEFFGKARPVRSMGITYGTFEAAGSSPSNNDVYLSDKLDVGRRENLFQAGTVDRSGFTSIMPLDIDSSTPLKFRMKYIVSSGNAGDIKLVVRWGTSKGGDNVYRATSAAPSVGVNEQELSTVIPVLSSEQNTEKIADVYLDVSSVIPELGAADATSLWITFERQGTSNDDTYDGNVAVIDIKLYYVSWRLGGYLENY